MSKDLNNIEQEIVLLEELKAGKKEAFIKIFDRYWSSLYKMAYYKLRSSAEAEEIVQELFITLWDKHETLVIKNLSSYLFSATKKRVLNCIRSMVTQEKYWEYCKNNLPVYRNSTEETIIYGELTEEIERILNRLPERSQKVFRLNRIEGRSISEIAVALNLSKRTIEYDLEKSLKELHVHLKDFIIAVSLFMISTL